MWYLLCLHTANYIMLRFQSAPTTLTPIAIFRPGAQEVCQRHGAERQVGEPLRSMYQCKVQLNFVRAYRTLLRW